MSEKSLERADRARRVASLRHMTGLSRREFAKRAGLSYSTLQHWEDIKDGMPENAVKGFLKLLLSFNIHCPHEWLLYGAGTSPQINQPNEVTLTSTHKKRSSSQADVEMTQINAETNLFLQHYKDGIQFIVPDDAMLPRFAPGEIVAGVRRYGKHIAEIVGQDCIVLIHGGDIYLRTVLKGSLEDCYHLAPTNPRTSATKPFLTNVELVSAAPVIWARRRNEFL